MVLVESSKKVKPWREAVGAKARETVGELLDGPLVLDVEFIMPRPKALGDKAAPPMVQRPDTDKLLRSTCDGLTGTAYGDDSQVVTIHAHKRRAEPGETPGAHITNPRVNEHTSACDAPQPPLARHAGDYRPYKEN